jgi:hypothetical protein
MNYPCVRATLVAAMIAALPGVAAAQFPPPPPPPSGSPPAAVQERWPNPPNAPQAEPVQQPAPQPAPRRQPEQAKPAPAPAPAADRARPAAQKPVPRVAATEVTCSGVFVKDSSHLKLATKYDSRNIIFGKVDGPDATKIDASILFPNDPRRRLEVLWNNEADRSETSVIAINGKSQWTAPKGLKLGLAIAALEKANGRPFKLTGFGSDGAASVVGWEGGALAAVPGGCKIGVRLFADPKTPENARSAVAGDKELFSNDPKMLAVKPTIGEILIGY